MKRPASNRLTYLKNFLRRVNFKMPISRRFFLKSGTSTSLTASLVFNSGGMAFGQKRKVTTTIVPLDGIPYQARQEPLLYYTRAAFDPCVGSVFTARGANGKIVELTLVSVTPYKAKAKTRITTKATRATDSFSLMFKASDKLPRFSKIPALTHPVLGKLEMFLTERVVDGEIFYEAVINHLM